MTRLKPASHVFAQWGLWLLVLLLVCLPAARAISCYQCTSFLEPDCENIMTGNATYDHLLKPCDGDYGVEEPFCRKMVQTLKRKEPIVRVRRACGWIRSPDPCYYFEDDDHIEVACQCFVDGCNAAAPPPSAAVAVALCAVASVASLRPH